MTDTAPLLTVLERIAKAIEDGNTLRRRETMKVEHGEQPRSYIGQGKEPTSDQQTSGRVRRPKQAANRS